MTRTNDCRMETWSAQSGGWTLLCESLPHIPILRFMLYLLGFVFTQEFWGFTDYFPGWKLTCWRPHLTSSVMNKLLSIVHSFTIMFTSQECRHVTGFSKIFRLRIFCGQFQTIKIRHCFKLRYRLTFEILGCTFWWVHFFNVCFS